MPMLFFLALSPESGRAEAPARLDLAGAIEYAIAKSPGLGAFRKEVEISELESSNSVARFFPSLDLSSTNGLRQSYPNPGSTGPAYGQLSLGLTENLYDNHISITRYRIADLNRELASLGFIKARAQLCYDVTREFFRYSLAVRQAEVSREQQTLLKKQVDSIEVRYRQGLTTRQDFLRLRAQLRRSDITLLTAENSIQRSAVELRKLLGTEPGVSVDFEPLEPRKLKVEEEVPSAPLTLKQSYEFRIAETQRQVNDLNVSFVKRRYWPEVSVTAGASYNNSNYLGSSSSTSSLGSYWEWNTVLSLRYNLWDWGIRRRDVASAELRKLAQDDQLDQSLLGTRAAIESNALELVRLRENYLLNEELLDLDTRNFEFLQGEYRQGRISYLDLINSLDNLADAKSRFFSSFYSLLQSLAEYRYYEGTIYESMARK